MLSAASDLSVPHGTGFASYQLRESYERKNAMHAMVTVSLVTFLVSGLAIMSVWRS